MLGDLTPDLMWLPEPERDLTQLLDLRPVKRLAAKHQLEAVVVGRIVGSGHHDAAMAARRRRRITEQRRRPAPDPHDIRTLGEEAVDQGSFELRRGQSAIVADGDAASPGLAEGHRVGPPDRPRI